MLPQTGSNSNQLCWFKAVLVSFIADTELLGLLTVVSSVGTQEETGWLCLRSDREALYLLILSNQIIKLELHDCCCWYFFFQMNVKFVLLLSIPAQP